MKVSVCTSNSFPDTDNHMVESILKRSKPYEIIQAGGDYSSKEVVNGVNIVRVRAEGEFYYYSPHAGGLHLALEAAQGDYILFCDSDVLFYEDVISYYVHLMEKYDLFIVGCTHYAIDSQCYAEFPCVINCMVKRSNLPGDDFLQGDLRMRSFLRYGYGRTDDNEGLPCNGKWLTQSPITKWHYAYPRPSGFFDVGHNLWLWNSWHEGRWISFGPHEVFDFGTYRYFTNILDKQIDLGEPRSLIWHKTAQGSWGGAPIIEPPS